MIFLFLFILGIFIGSFLNVVIDRLPREETVFFGRSHCDFCHHILAWYDMFPLFSFLLLRGKCRYCHKFVGWKYPIVEATTGALFALTPFIISPLISSLLFLILLGIISCLIIIFFTDLFSGIIPDAIVLVLFIITIPYIFILHVSFPFAFITAVVAGIFFLFLHIITKGRGMGLGDVKFAFVMGMLLGFPSIIVGLYIAFLTGTALSLILILRRKKSFASTIPFGPFLVLGTLLSLLWGQALWQLCMQLLHL